MPSAADFLSAPPKAAAPKSADSFLGEGPTENLDIPPAPKSADNFLAKPPVAPRSTPRSAESFLGDVTKPITGIMPEIAKESQEARAGLKRDVTTPLDPKHPVWGAVKRAGSIAGHAMDYAGAPATGALGSVIGTPIETITKGKISKETVGNVASIAIPLAGDLRAARLAAKGYEAVKGGFGTAEQAKSVQKLFAPATIGKGRDAAQVIRRAGGEADLRYQQSANELVRHQKIVAHLPVPAQRALVSYIENRSKGAKIPDASLQKVADDIHGVYDKYRKQIEYTLDPKDVPKFVEDYYAHMWQEKPSAVNDALQASRQGSGRNFKARSIPTIEEGLQAGLTPKTENPIDNTLAYAQNMTRYLATHDVQNTLSDMGHTGFHTPGSQPKGWVEIKGIRNEKPGTTVIKDGETVAQRPGKKLYAPEDVARVYNNWISKGLESADGVGDVYKAARAGANGLTQLKLGLSAYHGATMTQEAIVSEVARGFGALSRAPGAALKGDLKGAVRETGKGLKALGSAPAAPFTSVMRGKRLERRLLATQGPDITNAIDRAYVKSGQRLKMDTFYATRGGAGSFYQALKRGTFTRELKDAAAHIFGHDKNLLERAKGTIDLAGNVIQSTAGPIFEDYIPALKKGAFEAKMSDWLAANPGASEDEATKYAIKLGDSMDNRFGELQQDNLFWHKWMKQVASLVLLSPTWDIGTIREIGGGLTDAIPSMKGVINGKGVTDRTAYVAALASVVALENGVATYLKTGTTPKGKDFAAYRTGGTDTATNEPERGMIPGYQKDVYSFGYEFPNHVLPEAENKMNPALKAAFELAQNKDYRGLPIYRPHGVAPVEGEPTIMDYLLDQAMPISVGSLAKGKKVGSNISTLETMLGVRAAPKYMTAPNVAASDEAKYGGRDWKRRIKADARQKNRYENTSAEDFLK